MPLPDVSDCSKTEIKIKGRSGLLDLKPISPSTPLIWIIKCDGLRIVGDESKESAGNGPMPGLSYPRWLEHQQLWLQMPRKRWCWHGTGFWADSMKLCLYAFGDLLSIFFTKMQNTWGGLLNEKLCTFGFTKHCTLGRRACLESDSTSVRGWLRRAVSCVLRPKVWTTWSSSLWLENKQEAEEWLQMGCGLCERLLPSVTKPFRQVSV